MGLQARGAAEDSISCRPGGREPRGKVKEPHGASGGARAEEQDDTSGTDGSRELDETSRGDGTRKSGGYIGGGRSLDGTVVSRHSDGTDGEGEDSRMGTREGNGSTDHQSIRQWSSPGSVMEWTAHFDSMAPRWQTLALGW